MKKNQNGYLIVPNDIAPSFEKGWKIASKKGRIATLPEHALARIDAPRPHTPGKPWECYLDGSSPLWQSWLINSSCLLIGRQDGATIITVVHGLEPEFTLGPDRKWFSFSPNTWSQALEQAPDCGLLSAEDVKYYGKTNHEHSWFRRSDMLDNRLMTLIFGDALEDYTEDHRQLCSEYMYHVVGHTERFDMDEEQNRQIIDDPPIIELDFRLVSFLPEAPEHGAIGHYLCLNNIMNFHAPEFHPFGMTRLCRIDLVKPTDDCRFLVVK